MTNIINLPTYEQVQQVKETLLNVDATSGQLLDVNNKKYKAVMLDDFKILGADKNIDMLQPLKDDLYTKYPTFPPLAIESLPKFYLWGNYYLIQQGRMIIIADMVNLKVVAAHNVINGLYDNSQNDGTWFTDAKYMYIRGYSGSQRTTFAVLDKITFEYVTVIDVIGTNFHPYNVAFSNGIVSTPSGKFYIPNSTIQGLIYQHQISYHSTTGIPNGYSHSGHIALGVNAAQIWALLEVGEYMYAIWHNNSTMQTIEKFNIATGAKVGSATVTATGTQASKWSYVYQLNGVNYAVVMFGAQAMVHYNLDTMSIVQNLSGQISDNRITFDYVNGDTFYVQRNEVIGVEINGTIFERLTRGKLNKTTGIWDMEQLMVPARREIISTTSTPPTRAYFTGNGFIKDGKLLLRKSVWNTNVWNVEMLPVNYISHYKEVIK